MLKTFILVIKLILKIICSTFDVKSDLVLSISLYSLGHPIFATLLITPFIINYVLTWICWGRLDENKRVSWIAAGLAIYPQYCAGQIIYLMRTDKDRDSEKKTMDREKGEFEIFEALISTVILTCILGFSRGMG